MCCKARFVCVYLLVFGNKKVTFQCILWSPTHTTNRSYYGFTPNNELGKKVEEDWNKVNKETTLGREHT